MAAVGGTAAEIPTGILTVEGAGVDEDCWERALDVGWRRTTTGVVLLPVSGTVAYALDGLAARCWEALGRPMGLAALTAQLAPDTGAGTGAATGVDEDGQGDDDGRARQEVAEVVRFLVSIGVVHACVSTNS
jgi:hypothetical protein